MKFSAISILVILLSSRWSAAIAEVESTGDAPSFDPTGSAKEDKIHEGVKPVELNGLRGKAYGSLAEVDGIKERNLQDECPAGVGPKQWGRYHWDKCTVDVMVKTVLDASWLSYFRDVVVDWSEANSIQVTTGELEYDSGAARSCTPEAGQILVCNSRKYGNRWIGVAGIWADSGTGIIDRGYVKLNDRFLSSDSRFSTSKWRKMVMCQELGHAIGLAHWDENFNTNCDSCMDYSDPPFSEPSPRDLALLDEIYSSNNCGRRHLREHADDHLNPSEHADDHPTPSEEEPPDDNDWGDLVESNSHSSTYATKPDKDGHQWVTEVLWAE